MREDEFSLLDEKMIQSRQVFSGRVFSVEVQSVALANGEQSEREIVRHHGGACVVACDDQDQIWLVRQYRSPFAKVMLEVPAGKLEPGEDPAVCARRELQEETGLTARNFQLLSKIYPSPGYCSEILSIYLATGLTPGPSSPDPGEILHCEVHPLEDVLQMIDRGEICDAKTIVALLTLNRRLAESNKQTSGVI